MSTATMATSVSVGLLIQEQSMPTPEVVAAAQAVLEQGLDLLSGLSDEQYALVVAGAFNASIGQHYRHILEHFQCLLRGMASGEVNYDARKRDRRIENQASYASDMTESLLRAIKQLTAGDLKKECRVVSSVSYDAGEVSQIGSNVGRELSYCVSHAIHHYAIVRLICAHAGVTVPPEFGYAPSTLRYQSSLSVD